MFESDLRRQSERASAVSNHHSVLDSAIGVQMMNRVRGDYLEFGVFRGQRLVQAYETAKYVTTRVLSASLEAMRFVGFDSFEGSSRASLEEVTSSMPGKAMAEGRIKLVKGWFQDTLTIETKRQLELSSASIVYIDCEYYESTVPCLEFITDLLVDGSILIFDDWWIFGGRKDRGEQQAFYEWKARHRISTREFMPGTAMSFVVQR